MLINTQALRNKILTLAVQGKLVPQDKADGTAEELFIQIQQEKQTLSGSLKNTAFDEITAYNAKTAKIKEQREKLLAKIDKQFKAEKDAVCKARLKTLSGSLKNKIKTYRTITPLNQNPDFTPPFDIPKEWAWVKLGEITRNVGNKSNQILAKDINKNGKFPVVSQGQSLIDGYSDQEKCVIYALPLIMFGDHTRKVKFIDFPFVVGADGTKFHKVICGYSKFIYFWMLTTADTLKNRGYARHYSLLTQIPIPLPPLAEQQRIVEKIEQAFVQLDEIDALQAQYQDNLTAFQTKLLKLAIHGELSAKYRRENVTQNSAPTVIASKRCSRGNLLTMESTAFDEIAAYNAKITQMKGQRETLLLQIEKQHKSEKNAHRKARLKTLSGSLKAKIKSYRTITPLNQNAEFTPPFDIPKEWAWVSLNQVVKFIDYRGKTPHKTSSGVFLITASNIKQGYMDYTRQEYISNEEYQDRQSRGITRKGDLLFTTEAPMGNVAICDLDICSCGQRVITFQKYTDSLIYLKLLMYFILSPQFQQQLLDNSTGTTAKGIKAENLKNIPIPLPPLAEQQFIAGQLEKLLDLCKKLKTKP